MNTELKISYGKPYPLGATYEGDRQVNFAVVVKTDEQCGVILYNKKNKTEERMMGQDMKREMLASAT